MVRSFISLETVAVWAMADRLSSASSASGEIGYGDGSGSGYCYGDGDGSGYGFGSGYGSGYGDGYGYGYCYGLGSGYCDVIVDCIIA